MSPAPETGPSPQDPHPIKGQPRVGFLKALVSAENVLIGDYTYYDDPDGPEHFLARCVVGHYPFLGDRLVIGRFCAIATGVRFLMNGVNHSLAGVSTYPFQIFGQGWEEGFDDASYLAEGRGDTVVGNDVWIGADGTILPGVTIGDGAVVAACSVVSRDVPPYAIVAGNPARVVRMRFEEGAVARLLALRWWDWDAAKITRNLAALRNGDAAALEAAA